MGLNRQTYRPCGFCFIEYNTREEAMNAIDCLNLCIFDGKRIRIDWDYGYRQDRQFGRGKTGGGQVRDERNEKYNQQNNRKR